MPASAFLRPRWGLEATPGNNAVADRCLQSFENFTATPKLPRTAVKAAGTLAAAGVYGAKDHTEWNGDGVLAYNDITHMLASALCRPVISLVTAGVVDLVYRPNRADPNAIQTFTVECGGTSTGSTAYTFSHAFVNDLSFSFDKNKASFSASGMGGQFYEDGVALSSPINNVPQVSIEPDTVNVYVADTLAGLSLPAAKLSRCIAASWAMSGRQTPIFTLDDAVGSYSTIVERKDTSFGGSITVANDSEGMAIMNRMRLKSVFFVRFEATGRDIIAANPYRFTHTFPCFINETQRSDNDDLYVGEYQLTNVFLDLAFGAGQSGFVETRVRVPAAESNRVTAMSVDRPALPQLLENTPIG